MPDEYHDDVELLLLSYLLFLALLSLALSRLTTTTYLAPHTQGTQGNLTYLSFAFSTRMSD
jgi:hypothetical protein